MGVRRTEEGPCGTCRLLGQERERGSRCVERKQWFISFANCLSRDSIWFHILYSQMDCKPRFDLSSKGHRKDSDKSRNRKDDDSLAEASHSKKTVKKAGNGEAHADW